MVVVVTDIYLSLSLGVDKGECCDLLLVVANAWGGGKIKFEINARLYKVVENMWTWLQLTGLPVDTRFCL